MHNVIPPSDCAWTGFYELHGSHFNMQIKKLKFSDHGSNKIRGKGKDDDGKFKIRGEFDSSNGNVYFLKEYKKKKKKHGMEFFGQWNNCNIVGTCKLPGTSGGTFLISQCFGESFSNYSDDYDSY